jgi:hypothetical protein
MAQDAQLVKNKLNRTQANASLKLEPLYWQL